MKSEPPTTAAMPARVRELPTWLISRAFAHSHRLLTEGFASVGSHAYHYRLLAALTEFGPASQADLSRRTRIDRSDVVAALNDLAESGFIQRSPDPDDRRRNIVTLTPAGAEQSRRLDEILDGIQDKLLAPLSDADRTQFIRLLNQLLDEDTPS